MLSAVRPSCVSRAGLATLTGARPRTLLATTSLMNRFSLTSSMRPAAQLSAPSLPARPLGFLRAFSSDSEAEENNLPQVCAILGGQWGDEGKGKLVDVLATKYDIVARFNGGANAGHTLVVDNKKFAFHTLPCGVLYPDKLNIIGNGVVVHIPTLFNEIADLAESGIDCSENLKISDRAHIVFDFHRVVDGLQEKLRQGSKTEVGSIGTTKKGIGPTYASKATRNSVRFNELYNFETFSASYRALLADLQRQYHFEYDGEEELARLERYLPKLLPMVTDTSYTINHALNNGVTLLAEGANAALLDLDFGTYPYVTSSTTTAGGVSTGLGIAPSRISSAIGIVKAYTTRVGAGPFPTEQLGDDGKYLQDKGHEFGTTTGRARRCGWLDIPVVQYSHQLNGYSSINITKLDVLSGLRELKIGTKYTYQDVELPAGYMPSNLQQLSNVAVAYETLPGWSEDISKCRTWEDLPTNAQAYVKRVEELAGVPVSWIGVGPGRDDMIKL